MLKYIVPLVVVLLAGCGTVPPTTVAQQKVGNPAPGTTGTKIFLLTKVVTQIPLGERVMNLQHGWGCFTGNPVNWTGGQINLSQAEFADTFRKEFTRMNYAVVGDPSALFEDTTASRAELLVAGAIEKLESNVCFPFSGSPNANIGITNQLKGSAYLRVRWQVYSKASGKVVMETTTEGSYTTAEIITSSMPQFFKNAFQANVNNLLADPKLFELAKPSSQQKGAGNV